VVTEAWESFAEEAFDASVQSVRGRHLDVVVMEIWVWCMEKALYVPSDGR
jgi:hypothetical protein